MKKFPFWLIPIIIVTVIIPIIGDGQKFQNNTSNKKIKRIFIFMLLGVLFLVAEIIILFLLK